MKLAELKKSLISNVVNTLGWHTNRKIVVFESDDWGSIRTSGNEALNELKLAGFEVNDCPYTLYDALESNKDVEILLDTLYRFKDKNENPANFTLNNIVANPDFKKIKESGFQKYYHENFTATYNRYPEHDKSFNLIKEGKSLKTFSVQLHGREHVNVAQWMKALRSNDKNSRLLFKNNMFSAHISGPSSCRNEYLQSFGIFEEDEIKAHHDIITEGVELFQKIWGHTSESFIAPCYTWNSSLEKTLASKGILYLQGTHIHKDARVPNDHGYFKKRFNYLGKKNKYRQKYIVRNCWYEPSQNPEIDNESITLKQIAKAFQYKKPAVICSHRLNYIGYLSTKNRDENIKGLGKLLGGIKKQWPDVEFLSTDELGKQMN